MPSSQSSSQFGDFATVREWVTYLIGPTDDAETIIVEVERLRDALEGVHEALCEVGSKDLAPGVTRALDIADEVLR